MSGKKANTLGTALYEWAHPEAWHDSAPAPTASSMFQRPNGQRAGGSATQLAQNPDAPTVNVTVNTKVDKQGGVQTHVSTPSGIKIAYTSPVMAGM